MTKNLESKNYDCNFTALFNNLKLFSMSVENKYNLDFYQALKIVMNGGCVKGDDFRDGIFLKLNMTGQLVIVDAAACYIESTVVFIKGMGRQKFRELSVLTMNALCD